MSSEEIKSYSKRSEEILNNVQEETCNKYIPTLKLFKDDEDGLRLTLKTAAFYFHRRLKEEQKKLDEITESTMKEIIQNN